MQLSTYRIEVAAERCEGCGICADVAPEVFALASQPPVALLRDGVASDEADLLARVLEARTLCPTSSIALGEERP